ncbi:MAG TPA: divergent polysaccharide deacetylase family protein [Rhizomicrobium sp.]|nr:divergent polysaccharide deacetylase family protein [Rhizomicrobium sp.]
MKSRAGRHGVDGGLVALLAISLAVGASSSLSGLGKFADAVTPSIAAQASDGLSSVDRHPLPVSFFASRSVPAPRMLLSTHPAIDVVAPRRSATAIDPARPVIAICIDDLGPDQASTRKAMVLPKAVTLAFLPFATATPALAEQAGQEGHEILAHVPMEPISATNPGPMTLKVGAPDIAEKLNWSLARVPGLSGINNHEGSKFSLDAASLTPVAEILSERHLFFFDSRTIAGSQIVPVSHKFGVESAGRDVFLDNVLTEDAIKAQLDLLAAKARKSGLAIAIGHPHGVTLRVLTAWLAEDRGLLLVPVSEAIRIKTERSALLASE